MRLKDCVLKSLGEDTWLHHTASGYKVRMNRESVAVLKSLAGRLSADEMTEQERFIYAKLSARGIAGPDTGRAEDREIPARNKSPLNTIELEFSGRCNLNCSHCFASMSGKLMERGILEKVFEGVAALEPVNLVLTGGEPLLNPLLPEALELARARRLRTSVMTNATLVTEATADLFRACGVAKAVVSLDFFQDTHDAIRGAGAFSKAVRGIKLLTGRKVPVHTTAMVQDGTAGRTAEFKDFCLKELGAAGIRFSSVAPIGKGKAAPAGLALAPEKLKELFRLGLVADGDDNGEEFGRLAQGRSFPCTAGTGQCFVSAEGEVYPCHYFQNLGEKMGELSAAPLAALYRGYPRRGGLTAAFDWHKLEKCRTCAHFSSCRGGCRARARIASGSWYEPDAYACGMRGVPAAPPPAAGGPVPEKPPGG